MALAGNKVRLVGIWPSKVAVAVARAWRVPPPPVIAIATDYRFNIIDWQLMPFDVAYPHFRKQAGLPV